MKTIFSFLFTKSFTGSILTVFLVTGGMIMFAGVGFALNAIFNPPQMMTGRERMEKFLIDGFVRKSGGSRPQEQVLAGDLNRRAMLNLGGYAMDEIAVNLYPRLAYRSPGKSPGPMPMLQGESGYDLKSALDMARFIPRPGEPPLRLMIPEPMMGTDIKSRLAEPEPGSAMIGFRPVTPPENQKETTGGAQIGFRPHEGAGNDPSETETPPVPLPAAFWMLLAGLFSLAGLKYRSMA